MNQKTGIDFIFKKYPRLSVVIFIAFFALVILLFSEWMLRKNGFKPGLIGDPGSLRIVDSLLVYPDFITDKHGITKINPAVIDIVNKFVLFQGADSLFFTSHEFNTVRYAGDVTIDFKHFNESATDESEFGNFIYGLKRKPAQDLDEVDSAYLKYSVSPINSDGFRSVEFKNYQTDKKKVLLLGDSFTWGMSARPIMNSFSDILSARGFVVFNSGMAAVDPAQYLSIAKVYIPILKPDAVIVNFYMGNDEMDYYRDAEPYHPQYHQTNAGLISAYPDKVYLEPKQAYEAILEKILIPHRERALNRVMSKTVLTTRLWLLVSLCNKKFSNEDIPAVDATEPEHHVSEFYIEEVKKLCEAHGSKMILVLIPFNEMKTWQPSMYESFKMQVKKNFKKASYYYPDNLEPEDFNPNDDHFNNHGMKKYAGLLQSSIDSVFIGKE